MAISRAIIYHSVGFDIKNLLRTVGGLNRRPPRDAEALVDAFQDRFASYVGTKHAVAFPYARTALYSALKSRRLDAGSEIIMPPITIKPMLDVVLALGLKPVFVDIERATLCFEVEELRRAITSRTRAILITYLFGVAPNVKQLISLCKEHGLFVIEDFSHSLNAEYEGRKLGAFGDIGIYSCSATKTLDAYGGGLAVTDDDALRSALQDARASLKPTPVKRLRKKIITDLVWNVATRKWVFTLAVFPLLKALRRFNPELEKKMTGARQGLKLATDLPEDMFEQFTWLQAQAGLAVMQSVDSQDARRIANVERYQDRLHQHPDPCVRSIHGARNVYWQFVIYPPDGEAFARALTRHGIDTGTTNLSLISGLGLCPEYEKNCPNAMFVKKNAFYIPAYGRLTRGDLQRVQRALREAFQPAAAAPGP